MNYNVNDEPYCDAWARLSEQTSKLERWRRGYWSPGDDFVWSSLLAADRAANAATNTIIVFTSRSWRNHLALTGAGRRYFL